MIDFAAWVEKQPQVTNLHLDPQNPRIPPSDAPLGQREVIAELVQHDKVYELAREIAEQGYSPVEAMIGVVEDGKQIILEGNRRLAALKLLISPESAPDPASVRRFRHLAASVPIETIKKVRVLFAPNREAAGPLIASKHTRDQIERWSTIMQARFFRSLAKAGLTPQEIATRYGRTPGDVAGFLRVDEMYDIACAIDLPENVREVVHNPRLFPAAVLERLIEIPKAREILGIEFDDRGSVRGKVHPDEFRKGFRRILTDIATKKIDTRTLNRVEDAEKYLRALGADRPNLSRRGKFTIDDVRGTKAPADKAPAAAAAAANAKTPRVSYGLIPSGVKCGVANPRIRQIFEELRRLRPVERYPNSCAALLRILLELSMGNYLDKTEKIRPLLDKAKKENKPSDWYPPWKQMLRAILGDSEITTISPLARKHLNRIVSDRDSPLDGFVHNRFELAEPDRLRNIASAMEGILKVMLDESAWPKPAPAKK